MAFGVGSAAGVVAEGLECREGRGLLEPTVGVLPHCWLVKGWAAARVEADGRAGGSGSVGPGAGKLGAAGGRDRLNRLR